MNELMFKRLRLIADGQDVCVGELICQAIDEKWGNIPGLPPVSAGAGVRRAIRIANWVQVPRPGIPKIGKRRKKRTTRA